MAGGKEKRLLIIDDDQFFCHAIATHFRTQGINLTAKYNGREGMEWLQHHQAEVILLDQNLPDGPGLELCAPLLGLQNDAKIIFITAYPSFEHAVLAMRNGAYDYLSKPMELEELELAVMRAFRTVELERLEQFKKFHDQRKSFSHKLIGIDNGLKSIEQMIHLAASTRAPVLITGETGTGKNVVAKFIHYLQQQTSSSLVEANCAALPENLMESELFGHEKGAFTGAHQTTQGLFEMADNGTLFLDEIGEIPLHLQAKLLGVLDNGTIRRIGGQTSRQVDVRIIAATNIDLEKAIANKTFREDLYYRLSVLRIHIPPLRHRKDDIEPLCRHFIHNRIPDQQLTIPLHELTSLQQYDWPGNVRELKNIIERSIIFRTGTAILPAQFIGMNNSHRPSDDNRSEQPTVEIEPLSTVEKRHIDRALNLFRHNHTHVAKALGIARSTLIRKIEQYSLKTGDSKQDTVAE